MAGLEIKELEGFEHLQHSIQALRQQFRLDWLEGGRCEAASITIRSTESFIFLDTVRRIRPGDFMLMLLPVHLLVAFIMARLGRCYRDNVDFQFQ